MAAALYSSDTFVQAMSIKDATAAHPLIRFGVFELDLRASELRKKGVKVKLQDQPCQILAMLLEHPGEIVSREELRNRLWQRDQRDAALAFRTPDPGFCRRADRARWSAQGMDVPHSRGSRPP